MSYTLTAKAIESDLNPSERLVFIALAHCANDSTSYDATNNTWKSWPGINRLLRYTGLSKSTVQRALRSLVLSGDIKVEQRKLSSHRNLTNIYTLFAPNPSISSPTCVAEEVTPPEVDAGPAEDVIKTPSPSEVGVTEIEEGVTETPEQITKTNNKNIYYAHEREEINSFDPQIPPHRVMPQAWSDYLGMLKRRNRPMPDEQQHHAQGEFLGEFDPMTQQKIIQQSLRNGWVSLHPVSSVRTFNKQVQRPTRDKSLWEELTDRSWADNCLENLNVVASV